MRSTSVLVMALALASCTSTSHADNCPPTRILNIGDKVPDCQFKTFDGSVLKLTSAVSKPTIMNFWASWCDDCVAEMPALEQVFRQLGPKVSFLGFDATGVDGESERDARSFAKARGVTYPLVFDQAGHLYSHFSFRTQFPMTLLVAPGGSVAYRQFGKLDQGSLRSLIHNYLKL